MAVKRVKIVCIGAGALGFTTGVIADLIRCPDLHGSTVALVDIDPTGLEMITKVARRMVESSGAEVSLEATQDRREALPGADFVINTIQVGSYEGWKADIEIPLKYGIYQTVGDSVGPGAVSRFLRTCHTVVGIGRDMEELCPDAFVINYANPNTGIVDCFARHTKVRGSVGLCHGVFGRIQELSSFLEEPAEDFSFMAAGVNHFTWLTELKVRGEDAYPLLDRKIEEKGDAAFPVGIKLYQTFGLFPSPADPHLAEFVPWFNRDVAWMRQRYGLHVLRAELAQRGREQAWQRFLSWAEGKGSLERLMGHSGEQAIEIISDIAHDRRKRYDAINVPNRGFVTNLPEGQVVEVPGYVDGSGFHGECVGALPGGIGALLAQRGAQVQLAVDAGVKEDRGLAVQAMALDPLVPSIEAAEMLVDELILHHKQWMPERLVEAARRWPEEYEPGPELAPPARPKQERQE
jgi:alpha-galactosidase